MANWQAQAGKHPRPFVQHLQPLMRRLLDRRLPKATVVQVDAEFWRSTPSACSGLCAHAHILHHMPSRLFVKTQCYRLANKLHESPQFTHGITGFWRICLPKQVSGNFAILRGWDCASQPGCQDLVKQAATTLSLIFGRESCDFCSFSALSPLTPRLSLVCEHQHNEVPQRFKTLRARCSHFCSLCGA